MGNSRILMKASTTMKTLARQRLDPHMKTTAPNPKLCGRDFFPSIHFSQKELRADHLATAEFRMTQKAPQKAMYEADALQSHLSKGEAKCSFQAAAWKPP